jgi:hypothetical protein
MGCGCSRSINNGIVVNRGKPNVPGKGGMMLLEQKYPGVRRVVGEATNNLYVFDGKRKYVDVSDGKMLVATGDYIAVKIT